MVHAPGALAAGGFATVAIAFLFTRLRLLKLKTATTAVLFSTTVFLFGGILGTLHHLELVDTVTGEKSTLEVDGAFVAIGHAPATAPVPPGARHLVCLM